MNKICNLHFYRNRLLHLTRQVYIDALHAKKIIAKPKKKQNTKKVEQMLNYDSDDAGTSMIQRPGCRILCVYMCFCVCGVLAMLPLIIIPLVIFSLPLNNSQMYTYCATRQVLLIPSNNITLYSVQVLSPSAASLAGGDTHTEYAAVCTADFANLNASQSLQACAVPAILPCHFFINYQVWTFANASLQWNTTSSDAKKHTVIMLEQRPQVQYANLRESWTSTWQVMLVLASVLVCTFCCQCYFVLRLCVWCKRLTTGRMSV